MTTPTIRFCCAITSETKISYGSLVSRQGRSRPFRLDQAKSSSSTPWSLDEAPAAENGAREQPCEQTRWVAARRELERLRYRAVSGVWSSHSSATVTQSGM